MIRLATSPEPHSTLAAHSVLSMFKDTKNSAWLLHRDIPAPEPSPEPNPEPDAAITAKGSVISSADWDTLFDAVTDRLQASSAPMPLRPDTQHALGTGATLEETVTESVASLNLLHLALQRQRKQP